MKGKLLGILSATMLTSSCTHPQVSYWSLDSPTIYEQNYQEPRLTPEDISKMICSTESLPEWKDQINFKLELNRNYPILDLDGTEGEREHLTNRMCVKKYARGGYISDKDDEETKFRLPKRDSHFDVSLRDIRRALKGIYSFEIVEGITFEIRPRKLDEWRIEIAGKF